MQYARQLERGEPEPSKRYWLTIQRADESRSAERHVKEEEYRCHPPEILGDGATVFLMVNNALHISPEVQHGFLLWL